MSSESTPRFTVRPVETPPVELPDEFNSRLVCKAFWIILALLVVLLIVVLAPGLGEVREGSEGPTRLARPRDRVRGPLLPCTC